MESRNCSTVDCFVPELSALRTYTPSSSPYLGHQDFQMGCLIAVNESLTVKPVDGHYNLIQAENYFFFEPGTTITDVQTAAWYGTICHSTNGSAPEVLVPYAWCRERLPGWQAASWSGVMAPLVQFILPCVVSSDFAPKMSPLLSHECLERCVIRCLMS